jgi:2-amino-4-hydroxy-6-hydroxymethyldihydropteridine diphosphokinase|tara:strand:+ start:979 stop:1491 length:513 start_codon:yes stop_codon:yes gene_type:complete
LAILSLSLGSNIDVDINIHKAVTALQEKFSDLRCSSIYESEAIGFVGDNFLNLVAVTDCEEDLQCIVDNLKALEDALGRDHSQPRFSARPIDIDILTYGDISGSACGMSLPRAEITQNAFVLRPLAELLPDSVHRPDGLTYAELWENFDQSSQKLWRIDLDRQQRLTNSS